MAKRITLMLFQMWMHTALPLECALSCLHRVQADQTWTGMVVRRRQDGSRRQGSVACRQAAHPATHPHPAHAHSRLPGDDDVCMAPGRCDEGVKGRLHKHGVLPDHTLRTQKMAVITQRSFLVFIPCHESCRGWLAAAVPRCPCPARLGSWFSRLNRPPMQLGVPNHAAASVPTLAHMGHGLRAHAGLPEDDARPWHALNNARRSKQAPSHATALP